MPLGNLTSQFFANVYLNELDYFVKHTLKAKYYIRYVDDFIIIHPSHKQLHIWKEAIDVFLTANLKIQLHPHKTHIFPLVRGVDFVGFRNFYRYCLVRKRNLRTMQRKVTNYKKGTNTFEKIYEQYRGWNAYIKWGNSHRAAQKIKMNIIDILLDKV